MKIFSPYFRLPPIGKAPQSLRDSSPQGSGFREMVAARNGPSRENAVQKRPQAFLNCQYKNFISAKYAQSNAEGILNRPPCPEQANKKASAKKLALARLFLAYRCIRLRWALVRNLSAAAMKPLNRGWARLGRLLNSG